MWPYFNPGNVKFGLRDPDLIFRCHILPWLKETFFFKPGFLGYCLSFTVLELNALIILLLHLTPVNPSCKAAKKLAIYIAKKERFKIESAKIN